MIAFLLAASLATAAPEPPKAPTPAGVFRRIVVVVLENTDYRGALRQPFLKKLAQRGALLTHFHAESHPSQPNYVALVAGTTEGVPGDSTVDLNETHLGDLLGKAERTWKAYAEDYPGDCFLGATHGRYARKHVPFISFVDVHSDPGRCGNIVNAKRFVSDFKKGLLPDFSLYIPDLDNDGHDTGVKYADRQLEKTFGPLTDDPVFQSSVLLIVTFDEDDSLGDNHVYTALFGSGVRPGSTSDKRYNHYSLLRLVEDEFKLGSLGRGDATAEKIEGVWKP